MFGPEFWRAGTGHFYSEFTAESYTLWTWTEKLLNACNGWLMNDSKAYNTSVTRLASVVYLRWIFYDLSTDSAILDVVLKTAKFIPGGLTFFLLENLVRLYYSFCSNVCVTHAKRKVYWPKLFLKIQNKVSVYPKIDDILKSCFHFLRYFF